jgi:hypothetical protein
MARIAPRTKVNQGDRPVAIDVAATTAVPIRNHGASFASCSRLPSREPTTEPPPQHAISRP